jgi:hypothetical protein
VRGWPAGSGLCHTPGHEPVWTYPMAEAGGTLSPRMRHPAGGPLDETLGVQPQQRTSDALLQLGCALAVFVPFATAARLLGWSSGRTVSPQAVGGRQAAGQRAMETRQEHLHALAQGDLPAPEALAADRAAARSALGADGVMVPFRPIGGQPTGKTRWQAITGGVLARLGQHRTRTGKVVTPGCTTGGWWRSWGMWRR